MRDRAEVDVCREACQKNDRSWIPDVCRADDPQFRRKDSDLALFGRKCHLDTRSLSFLQSNLAEVSNLPCNYLHLNDLDELTG
jgi:hypothetical protein